MRHPRSSLRPHQSVAAALLLLAAVSLRAADQDPPRYTEKVEVARILLDVRAIDPRGRPLVGLEPSDFEVKIDGKPGALEGQYVLFVEKPTLRPGSHRLDVRLKGRDGVVLAPPTYLNDPCCR